MGQNGSRELKKPVLEPVLEQGTNGSLSFGYAGVQGYRAQMEDAHVCVLPQHTPSEKPDIGVCEEPDIGVFAVLDGHGGPGAAAYAATHLTHYIVEALKPLNEAHPSFPSLAVQEIQGAFIALDTHMRAHVADYRTPQDMEDPGVLHYASEDHKPDMSGEKARVEAAGGFIARGRVCNCLAVSRALGDHVFKEARELPPHLQMVSAVPDVVVLPRNHALDEFAVIACDGVFDVLRNASIVTSVRGLLLTHDAMQDVCKAVVHDAMQRGTTDNVSALVVAYPGAVRVGGVADVIDGLFTFGDSGSEHESESESESVSEGERKRESEGGDEGARGVGASPQRGPVVGQPTRRLSSYTGHNQQDDETEA